MCIIRLIKHVRSIITWRILCASHCASFCASDEWNMLNRGRMQYQFLKYFGDGGGGMKHNLPYLATIIFTSRIRRRLCFQSFCPSVHRGVGVGVGVGCPGKCTMSTFLLPARGMQSIIELPSCYDYFLQDKGGARSLGQPEWIRYPDELRTNVM